MDYRNYFKQLKRSDGKHFITVTDDAPVELKNFIHCVHSVYFFKCLPNDWIYSIIQRAFEELHLDSLQDINIEADIYNHDLAYWFYNNCNQYAHEYCNEWLEDCYYKDLNIDMIEIIRKAQEVAKIRIYCLVNDFIQQQKEVKNEKL